MFDRAPNQSARFVIDGCHDENHRTSAGKNLGTLRARAPELLALASVLRDRDAGVFQFLSDSYRTTDDDFARAEFDLITQFAVTAATRLRTEP